MFMLAHTIDRHNHTRRFHFTKASHLTEQQNLLLNVLSYHAPASTIFLAQTYKHIMFKYGKVT